MTHDQWQQLRKKPLQLLLVLALCPGLVIGIPMTVIGAVNGWAGERPAPEWIGPGFPGLFAGILFGAHLAFFAVASLWLMILSADSRAKMAALFAMFVIPTLVEELAAPDWSAVLNLLGWSAVAVAAAAVTWLIQRRKRKVPDACP